MNLASAVALVKLLLSLRDLIDAVIKATLQKHKDENLEELTKAISEYKKGATIDEKVKAANLVRDLFTKP